MKEELLVIRLAKPRLSLRKRGEAATETGHIEPHNLVLGSPGEDYACGFVNRHVEIHAAFGRIVVLAGVTAQESQFFFIIGVHCE